MTAEKIVVPAYLTITEKDKVEALARLTGFSKTFVVSTLVRQGLKKFHSDKNNTFKMQMLQALAEAEAVEFTKNMTEDELKELVKK